MNGLGEVGAKAVGDLLKVNGTIEDLDLTSSRINDRGVIALTNGLIVNNTLKHLKVFITSICLVISARLSSCHILCNKNRHSQRCTETLCASLLMTLLVAKNSPIDCILCTCVACRCMYRCMYMFLFVGLYLCMRFGKALAERRAL